MRMHITPANGAGASLSDRDFFAVATAPTAAAFPAPTTPQADRETDGLPSPTNHQLHACVAQLKSILMRMHPEATDAGSTRPDMISNPDGSFLLLLSGCIPARAFEGDGCYFVSMDGYPQPFHLAHRHTFDGSTGVILPRQDYDLATAIHEDRYVERPQRSVIPRIMRKIEGGPEL